ncbi:MAG: MoaD/ThiS family protein [Planctomycetes bacterium]|nr:MoaD/ThiS family protein [Planctomycetota bacterium]
MSKRVEVLLFASLAERAATDRVAVDVEEDDTASDLLARIGESWPSLAGGLASVRVAVDHRFRAADEPLLPGEEFALIPPVSGG